MPHEERHEMNSCNNSKRTQYLERLSHTAKMKCSTRVDCGFSFVYTRKLILLGISFKKVHNI